MSLFLAVDAGGTKTGFLLADDLRELARARTGTIKRMRTDALSAKRNLQEGLASLEEQAGVALAEVTRTCIGAAGWTVPVVAEWMRASFAERIGGDLLLVGDVEIALDAAFHGGPGVLVLAGTGSNVAGRGFAGEISTVGGWGPVLADQGSGHRIGHEALRAMFLALDEGRESALLPAVLALWHLRSATEVIDVVHRSPGPDLAQLAHLVARAAVEGDPVAQTVLDREARDLAHLAALMLRRIYGEPAGASGATEPPRIAFAGSIMEHIGRVRTGIEDRLLARWPELAITPGVVDPLLGALWRARLDPAEREQRLPAKSSG